ncbi:MAG: M20 family metallopeptidase [Anaerolineae bacterium]|nr:M20 family metallopeptidase [Anaerolineae bacterium]
MTAPLSALHTKALEFVDRHQDALIAFASSLIATPSPTPPGNEQAVAQVARERLWALGFPDVAIFGPRPERANLVCRYDTGRPGRVLLLNGHLDTKPIGKREAWETDPFQGTIKNGRLYGLGAVDMKGADAALVYGLAAAVQAGADHLNGRVILALSADEEGEALDGARYLVREIGVRADAALIAEPCGISKPWEMIPLISRGFCGVRFTVKGTPRHSSISDRLPVINASLEASRLLLFLKDELRLTHPPTPLCPQGPTVNLGATLKGGQALAIVPGEAEFTADIRTLPGMTQAQVAQDLDRAMAEFRRRYPQAQVSWTFVAGNLAWTTPTQVEPDVPLVPALREAVRQVLGKIPPFGYCPGGTDAIWWQGAGNIPTIPAFGPGLMSNAHMPNEFVGLDELVQAAKIYALLILNYLGKERIR